MTKVRVFEAFAGYGSQAMACKRLQRQSPGEVEFEFVGVSEIETTAIKAYEAVHGDVCNYGDISLIDWSQVPDFDLFTYSFPCFVAGTWIRTSKGLKKIEEITAEDYVLTHTNTYKKVVTPMQRDYQGVTYSLECPLFQSLVCTEKHPLYVRAKTKGHTSNRKFGEPQWLSPREMMQELTTNPTHGVAQTRGYHIGYAINQKSELPEWDGVVLCRGTHYDRVNAISDKMRMPSFWYVMGRYVGDGWKRSSPTSRGIVICCSDRNRDKLVEALNITGIKFNEVCERTVIKLHISSTEYHEFVGRYGYYAHGKHIDAETINLPCDLLCSFIEGVIDSDGHKDAEWCHISSVSEELVYDLGQCVAKAYHRPFSVFMTKRPKTTVIEGRTVNQRDSWTVRWKATDDKQDRAFYEDGYIWSPIMKMTWQQSRCKVYNMEVEEDNSYTANGVIVHNCQDISNAGLQKGFVEGSGSRSSLLWECRRAIEAKSPKWLLMENVKALTQKKFMPEFQRWIDWLSEQGYANFWQVLNSKNYGVPQNRERVFMISIKRTEADPNPTYNFPSPFPLEKRLKDVLETNVDESYYLKQEQVDKIIEHCERKQAEGCGFKTNF